MIYSVHLSFLSNAPCERKYENESNQENKGIVAPVTWTALSVLDSHGCPGQAPQTDLQLTSCIALDDYSILQVTPLGATLISQPGVCWFTRRLPPYLVIPEGWTRREARSHHSVCLCEQTGIYVSVNKQVFTYVWTNTYLRKPSLWSEIVHRRSETTKDFVFLFVTNQLALNQFLLLNETPTDDRYM